MSNAGRVLRVGTGFVATAAAVLLAVGPTSIATAAWNPTATGSAAASADTMPTGGTPTATANGTAVSVSWPAATLPSGPTVAGYTVSRYNSINGAPSTVGGTCTGVVTTTSCSDRAPSGSWVYTDTPVQLSWTGTESPPSAPVTVVG